MAPPPGMAYSMSSRLALDPQGRKIVIVTSSTDGLPIGHVYLVVDWNGFFTPPGRAPTARERAEARPPYESNSAKRARLQRVEVPDDELDEQAAVEAARREQQRAPVDLINVAAYPRPGPRARPRLRRLRRQRPARSPSPRPARGRRHERARESRTALQELSRRSAHFVVRCEAGAFAGPRGARRTRPRRRRR
jgi:hypothetical protein